MNDLINNEDNSTNAPHTYEYMDVAIKEAGNQRARARDGALSQHKAHGVHSERGDSTNIPHLYEENYTCESLDDVIKEKDEKARVTGQIAAINPYYQDEGFPKKKMVGMMKKDCYVKMSTP